ncbi:ribosomal protein S18-alanine N-acetyltransferase [Bacillaceae bacterium Marseille-Q3522]|nr:ribosomal protein S18-alanine N-acetyltransferase [Bacillaceae bacterium Marseille-Q3522]
MRETLQFRYMTEEDIEEVLEIERLSFSVPWTREAFYYELQENRFAVYLVLLHKESIIGYCGSWIVMDEAHITNVAILPEYRGKKFGRALMEKIMNVAREMGAKRMTLEVRVSNHIAQSLYRKFGFQNGSIRKNYYSDIKEDALVMWVNL